MDKDELIKDLENTLQDWKGRPAFPQNMVPVLVTGSDITYPEVMHILEAAGLRIVRDDMSLGERYFAQQFRPGQRGRGLADERRADVDDARDG